MKTSKILTFILALVIGTFIALPSNAEEYNTLDKNELNNILIQEIKSVQNSVSKETENYLKEHTLDFLGQKDVSYFRIGSQIKNCNKSKYCAQFKEMSSLIAKNDNDTLKKFLDEGYDPRLYIEIGNKRTRNLFTQAILSNNKGAVKVISDAIKGNKILIQDMYTSLYNLLVQDPLAVRAYYNKEFETREQELKTPITSKDISNAVINGDEIDFLVSYDLIDDNADKATILLNAIYEIIDYRIKQGY